MLKAVGESYEWRLCAGVERTALSESANVVIAPLVAAGNL